MRRKISKYVQLCPAAIVGVGKCKGIFLSRKPGRFIQSVAGIADAPQVLSSMFSVHLLQNTLSLCILFSFVDYTSVDVGDISCLIRNSWYLFFFFIEDINVIIVLTKKSKKPKPQKR